MKRIVAFLCVFTLLFSNTVFGGEINKGNIYSKLSDLNQQERHYFDQFLSMGIFSIYNNSDTEYDLFEKVDLKDNVTWAGAFVLISQVPQWMYFDYAKYIDEYYEKELNEIEGYSNEELEKYYNEISMNSESYYAYYSTFEELMMEDLEKDLEEFFKQELGEDYMEKISTMESNGDVLIEQLMMKYMMYNLTPLMTKNADVMISEDQEAINLYINQYLDIEENPEIQMMTRELLIGSDGNVNASKFNESIKRKELMFLYNIYFNNYLSEPTAEYMANIKNVIKDWDSLEEIYKKPVAKMYYNKIVTEYKDGTFKGDGFVTGIEGVTMTYKLHCAALLKYLLESSN